jgi:hypothetical protein
LSVPDSSPLIAFAFEIGATRFAVDVVTLEKLLPTDDVLCVLFVLAVTLFVVTITGVGAVVVGLVDVVVFGT